MNAAAAAKALQSCLTLTLLSIKWISTKTYCVTLGTLLNIL